MTAPELLPEVACAAPGCRRQHVGGRLCPWHAERLGQTLADLRGDLTASSEPALTGWRTGPGGAGVLASERDPINLRRLDAQKQAPPVLQAWAAWVCEQRDLNVPGWPEGNRALLAEQRTFRWICDQPEVTEFWVQIRALWATLRGHLPVRRCTCGGPVWLEPGGGWCSWCATAWSGSQLLELPRAEEAA